METLANVHPGEILLEEEENRIIALREAIQEGIESGIAYDFSPESHLEQLKAKKKLK
jgi:antitoxin ParD1/3/4